MNAYSRTIVPGEVLRDGTMLGRHRVVGKLSEGAHAILYVGAHAGTGAEVAIKVLRANFVRNPEMVARFDREARVMGRLAGAANVVHVHDIGVLDDGRSYLVMEFVRGRDLATVIANGRRREVSLELDRVLAIASDLGAALRDAHGAGIVHRDIKPGNVMLIRLPDGTERAKLVDFGVSADLEARGAGPDLTVQGSIIGTPEYMSPEQAIGLPAAIAMDVFSLGVLLYELLSGRLPPMQHLRAGVVPRISTLRGDVPSALDELLDRCLRVDPRLRLRDGIELLSWLSSARDERHAGSGPNKSAGGRPVRAAGAIEVDAGPSAHAVVAALPAPSPLVLPTAARRRAERRAADVRRRARTPWIIVGIVLLGASAGVTTWLLGARVAHPDHDATTSDAAVIEPADDHAAAADNEEATRRDASLHDDVAHPSPGDVLAPATPVQREAPSVEVADERAPISDVRPRSRASTPTKPAKPPAKPPAEAPDCPAAREAARASADALEWKHVVTHTNVAACWPDRDARLRLRVEALAELARHESCIREGEGSSDPVVVDLVDHCRARAGVQPQ